MSGWPTKCSTSSFAFSTVQIRFPGVSTESFSARARLNSAPASSTAGAPGRGLL